MRSPDGQVGLRSIVADTVLAALGQNHRADPVAPSTGGPAGNARLTAWIGLLLLVLSVAELVTLIDVGGWIGWHIVIGTLLVPPAVLKTLSTGWRIARYYNGAPAYREAGPPPLLLRILGPGVVASTLGLLASGLALVLLGRDSSRTVLITAFGQRVDWLTVHQGTFIVWGALTGLHVLGRTVPAVQLTVLHQAGAVGGARSRAAALFGTVVLAGVLATLVLAASGSWRHNDHRRLPGDRGVSTRP